MGNQFFVKNTFDTYFDRLQHMAETLEKLREIATGADAKVKGEINCIVGELEREMQDYAKRLRTGGTEIIKRVA